MRSPTLRPLEWRNSSIASDCPEPKRPSTAQTFVDTKATVGFPSDGSSSGGLVLRLGNGEQTHEFLLDHLQPAPIGIALLLQYARQLGLALEVNFSVLMDFDVHHFFQQLDE